jgi:oxygen-independent coproporphyrinogen III oxidase
VTCLVSASADVRPWVWPRAAYIHVPFCAHKCGYCDFASLAGVDHLADRYLSALEFEIERSLGQPREVDTIFVGGGTPTRLNLDQLSRLTSMIKRWLILTPGGEWTVEANPGTLDSAKADVLAAAGVDRVSLGAQSFQPGLLRVLERNHGRAEVETAVEIVRPRFPRWSLDLIFGVPGSTIDHWREDLDIALDFGPAHLSCYGLVFEKGTALWNQLRSGEVEPVDEEVERTMFDTTIERLARAGLTMYEISNFAKLGHECRHNLVYWANDAYFGFGLGAARYIRGVRSTNTRDLLAYLRRVESSEPATGPVEELSAEGRARETAILMLRRIRWGIERDDFMERTGFNLDALAGPAIERFKARGCLEDDGHRLRLTRDGIFVADSVLCEFL